MSKKQQEQLAPKGKRISGRKASAERYIPFQEFLLYDPLYRQMKEKAKILYAFLRKKTLYFEEKQEALEEAIANGEEVEGTKSYRDENDEIFCIADNSELSIILQCHYNRVPDPKKELKEYGLLEEVKQKNGPSRLYVLDPTELTDSWTYIEEMKELRKKVKEENRAKFEKRKAKEAEESKTDSSNSQNVSYGNSQNVSYGNSQNVSKTKSKGFKSNLKSFKSNLNLSISEDIQKTALPLFIQKSLDKQIDRLIEYKLNVFEIDLHYKAVAERVSAEEYGYVLDNLVKKLKEQPRDFGDVMNNWLARNRERMNQIFAEREQGKKYVRSDAEYLPDWFMTLKEEEALKEADSDFEKEKRELEESLKKFGRTMVGV